MIINKRALALGLLISISGYNVFTMQPNELEQNFCRLSFHQALEQTRFKANTDDYNETERRSIMYNFLCKKYDTAMQTLHPFYANGHAQTWGSLINYLTRLTEHNTDFHTLVDVISNPLHPNDFSKCRVYSVDQFKAEPGDTTRTAMDFKVYVDKTCIQITLEFLDNLIQTSFEQGGGIVFGNLIHALCGFHSMYGKILQPMIGNIIEKYKAQYAHIDQCGFDIIINPDMQHTFTKILCTTLKKTTEASRNKSVKFTDYENLLKKNKEKRVARIAQDRNKRRNELLFAARHRNEIAYIDNLA